LSSITVSRASLQFRYEVNLNVLRLVVRDRSHPDFIEVTVDGSQVSVEHYSQPRLPAEGVDTD